MKKSIKIFISLLAFIFFAQVCFASYAINPEIQKYTTDYAEKQTDYDESEYEKRQKMLVWTGRVLTVITIILVICGAIGLGFVIAVM